MKEYCTVQAFISVEAPRENLAERLNKLAEENWRVVGCIKNTVILERDASKSIPPAEES